MDKYKLNIDGGGSNIEGYYNWKPSIKENGLTGVSVVHSNHIVMQRFFERLKDYHPFMREFYHMALAETELYLFAMDHDGVQEFMATVKGGAELAFGNDYVKDGGSWMRRLTIQETIDIFEEYGWDYVGPFEDVDGIKPSYPHHKLKFVKQRTLYPWQYALEGVEINTHWKILDVGPGNSPWPLADAYLEHESRKSNPAYRADVWPKDKEIIWGDIQQYNKSIPDQHFDFALCSHVFEHLENPKVAAIELCRIAKRGVVIVPSTYKDSLGMWDELDHKWDCFPRFGSLLMVRRNEKQIEKLRDQHMRSAMNRLFKNEGGNFDTHDHRYARKWFRKNEKNLDIIIPWEEHFEVEIV